MPNSEICGNCHYFQPIASTNEGANRIEGICTKPGRELPKTFSNLTPSEAHRLNNVPGRALSMEKEGWTCFVKKLPLGSSNEAILDLGYQKLLISFQEPASPEEQARALKDLTIVFQFLERRRMQRRIEEEHKE